MKNLTALLLLLALAMAVTVDADEPKGSFSLSGSFDPGFSFGRGGRNIKHRSSVRESDNNDDNDDESPDWPSPDQIHHFEIPEEFTHGGPHGDADEHDDRSGHNHKKSNHGKVHNHG